MNGTELLFLIALIGTWPLWGKAIDGLGRALGSGPGARWMRYGAGFLILSGIVMLVTCSGGNPAYP